MRMSIVHIHQKFYPYKGGSTQRLLNQLTHIDKSKFEIYVICQKVGNEPKEEIYRNIKIIRYKYFCQIPVILFKLSRKIKVSIIHAHNYRPSFYGYIFNSILKRPFIIEMHSIYSVKNKLSQWIGKKLLSKSNLVIVLSNKSLDVLRNDQKINQEIRIIYNGVNLDDFIYADKNLIEFDETIADYLYQSSQKGNIVAGYIGSLRGFQGIDNLVEIINSVKNKKVSFLVIGGSKEESEILISKVKNPNCYIREFVDKEQAKYIYKNLDILLMPRPSSSATNSALPLKPIEALAAGNIIFSTDVGGMKELKQITKSEKIIFMSVRNMIDNLSNLSNLNSLKDIYCSQNNTNDDGLGLFDINKQVKELENIYYSLAGRE